MENGVTKQLKMGEIKVEEDKEEVAQTSQCEMVQTQKPSMWFSCCWKYPCRALLEHPAPSPRLEHREVPIPQGGGQPLRSFPNSSHPTTPALGKWRLPNENYVCRDLPPAVSRNAQECSGMSTSEAGEAKNSRKPAGRGSRVRCSQWSDLRVEKTIREEQGQLMEVVVEVNQQGEARKEGVSGVLVNWKLVLLTGCRRQKAAFPHRTRKVSNYTGGTLLFLRSGSQVEYLFLLSYI